MSLSESELLTLDVDRYSRFWNVFDPMFTFAAVSGETVTPITGVSVGVNGNGTAKDSSGTVTVTATGSLLSKKTATITITNNSGSAATISFDYSISKANSHTFPAASGTYTSVVLSAGGTVTFTITSNSGWSNTTVTATLSNFSVVAAAAESNVTIQFDSGTVTVNGTGVANNSVTQIPLTGATIAATATNFVGWIDTSTNQILSTSASFTCEPAADMTIKALHGPTARFLIGTYAANAGYLYETLPAATAAASSGSNKTVILANNGTLPALTDNPTTTDVDESIYTIPAGVTLLIPRDAANTVYNTTPGVQENAYTAPSVYRTLTMASGASITVNGSISVAGGQSSKFGYNGCVSGAYGQIKMSSDSKISVANGAKLYCWGFITGSGSVEVLSGGTVYEDFQLMDFRGGDGTSQMANNTYGVFPMSQFYLQNIEVPLTLHAGAIEQGYLSFHITLINTQGTHVPIVSAEGGGARFQIESGYIIKDYMENTGREKFSIHGDVTLSSMSITMKLGLLGSTTINSAKFNLPIPAHFTVDAVSGDLSVAQNLALLPGSELYVRDGVNATMGENMRLIVYDWDDWSGYTGADNLKYEKLHYVPGGNGAIGREKDALVQVDGYVDASAGAVYVTSGGANIYSTGTGVIEATIGTEETTYQATQAQVNSSQEVTYVPISIQSPILRDSEETSIQAKANGTYTYYASTGKWCPPGHRYGEGVVTAPTCTAAGYTTHTCIACGNSYTDAEVPANGHNWGDWSTYKCNVCNCAAIQFSTIQLSIESEIQLLLKFTVHQDLLSNFPDLTAYVTEEKNRIEPEDSWNKKVTELPTDYGRYVISQGIAAGEMTGIVAVQFKNGETVIPAFDPVKNEMVNTVERSVISFAEAALKAEGEDGRNVALCKGALTFGGYAQQFFETHTDKLAYSFFGETAPDVAVSSWEGFTTTVTSTEGFTLIPTTQKINLDSKIDIRLYFEGEVGGCTVTVTRPINKGTDTETIALSFGNENGRTYLDIEDVPPAYWNDSYLITVTDGQRSYTVTTSVLAWCARCVQSPAASVEQQKMAQAMYHYSRAADAYFTEQNAQ